MLSMRLQRIGRKHQPSYRVVVAERRSKLGGPPVEDLGSYDPFSKTNTINQERAKYWIGEGAKPTTTVHNLLVSIGAIEGSKMPVTIKKKKKLTPEGEGATKVQEPAEPVDDQKDNSADDPKEGEGADAQTDAPQEEAPSEGNSQEEKPSE